MSDPSNRSRTARAGVLIYSLHCGNLYGTERMALATLEQFPGWRRIVLAPQPSTAGGAGILEEAKRLGYEAREVTTIAQLVFSALRHFRPTASVRIISTSAKHNIIFAALGSLLRVRLRQVNVVHGGGEDRYSYANKSKLNRMSVRLIAVSLFVREQLLKHGVLSKKVDVIPNFLPESDRESRVRRPPFLGPSSRAIDPEHVKVVVVSRVDPVKRLDILLDALGTGLLPNVWADVYGNGEEIEALRERARGEGLRIRFHGYVADVPRRLAEADVLVHLCPVEPFGLVVLEGMAAGLPVVVPDAGGAGELVENGVDGFTYDALNAVSLVQTLADIVLRNDRLDAIVACGDRALSDKFSARQGGLAYHRSLDGLAA